MSRRTSKATLETFQAPTFAAVTTFQKPGERQLPGALLVERQMLTPDPDQPRKTFDPEKLEELAESIRQVGLLQPLRVRPSEGGKYVIVNGERRWRACMLADVPEIPVVVRDSPADQLAFEMLVENLQRDNLSDEEEAQAYQLLIGQGYGVNEIARRLGVDKGRISRKVRVYEHEELATAVATGVLSQGQAQELLPVRDAEERQRLVEQVAEVKTAGQALKSDDVRQLVREAASYVPRKTIGDEEGVVGHNTFHNSKIAGGVLQPLSPAIVTLNNLARAIESFCDRHGTTPFTEQQKEPLRSAWERLSLVLRDDADGSP